MKRLLASLVAALTGERRPTSAAAGPGPRPAPASDPAAADETPFFAPLNPLEEQLVRAARDPAQRESFARMLLAADLYAATPEAPAVAGERTLEQAETVRILNVQAPDGTPVAAIFTAEPRIAEVFGTGVGFVAMAGKALLEIVADTGAMLNPGLAYGVHWDVAALHALIGRPQRRTLDKDTRILLGAPARRPEALIAALRGALAAEPGIAEAWLALAHWPEGGAGGDDSASWYLDVRSALGADAVNARLAGVTTPGMLEGRPLDLVVHPPGGEPGAGIRLVPAATH